MFPLSWNLYSSISERATLANSLAFVHPSCLGLTTIFSGKAGGPPGVLKHLVSNFLGVKQVPIQFDHDGKMRRFVIQNILEGQVEPIKGKRSGEDVMINNTEYWIGSEVTVTHSVKSKLRDFGRVWDLTGRSAEIMQINWTSKA